MLVGGFSKWNSPLEQNLSHNSIDILDIMALEPTRESLERGTWTMMVNGSRRGCWRIVPFHLLARCDTPMQGHFDLSAQNAVGSKVVVALPGDWEIDPREDDIRLREDIEGARGGNYLTFEEFAKALGPGAKIPDWISTADAPNVVSEMSNKSSGPYSDLGLVGWSAAVPPDASGARFSEVDRNGDSGALSCIQRVTAFSGCSQCSYILHRRPVRTDDGADVGNVPESGARGVR